MAIQIRSATFGDERSNTDVTGTLAELIKSRGSIDVPVNSSLVPVMGKGRSVKLDDSEVKDAQSKAEQACGGTSDQICLEIKGQEFQAQRLQEKRTENMGVESIIKGRRLRVTYVENGQVKVAEIPEGQTFKLGAAKGGGAAFPELKIDPGALNITLGGTVLEIVKWLGVALATFAYAFSILVAWRSLKEAGYVILKYAGTVVAVLIPYSGYFIAFGMSALDEFIKNLPNESVKDV